MVRKVLLRMRVIVGIEKGDTDVSPSPGFEGCSYFNSLPGAGSGTAGRADVVRRAGSY